MKRPTGIPTTYKGIRFRSRLEAKWAAFFDLLGWAWEYEPFDLNGWIPDFVIKGQRHTVLVEVKPIVSWSDPLAGTTLDEAVRAHLKTHAAFWPILLVGTGLWGVRRQGGPWSPLHGFCCVGMANVIERPVSPEQKLVRTLRDCCPLCVSRDGLPDALLPLEFGGIFTAAPTRMPHPWEPFQGAWAEASNAVQWKGSHT